MKEKISHGSGQMRAQSFSIQVSTRERCNGGCLFCISRTTPGTTVPEDPKDIQLCDFDRLRVGLNYARVLGATHSILTSRADPTQEENEYLIRLVALSREYLPLVDMHTNGFLLLPGRPKQSLLGELVQAGLTHLTLSIASDQDDINRQLMFLKESGKYVIGAALNHGILVRVSLVINKSGIADVPGIMRYIQELGDRGVHMVVVREVWIPEVYGVYNHEVYEWNLANWVNIGPLQDEFQSIAADQGNAYGLRLLDPLPWGTPVFVVGGKFRDTQHGVNVTFARCDEATTGTVMKSIVHKPNGHGYRNWAHNGDILY